MKEYDGLPITKLTGFDQNKAQLTAGYQWTL
ncbi:hypothetical protein HDF11_001829 [Tunturiibacter psychrotolerans]|jgi:hypothetical protein